MELSEHFTLEEATSSNIAAREGLTNTPDDFILENMKKAAKGMEKVRSLLGFPIVVSSWYRSVPVNKAAKGSATSSHPKGWAIDFICPRYGTPKQICELIVKSGIKFDQLIFEGTWVHISFEPELRGQVLTAKFRPGKKTQYFTGIV
jgi:zinc D-Ala-D-Ala carboxypeptidase